MNRKIYGVHVDGKLLGTLKLVGNQGINRLLDLKTTNIELKEVGVGQIINFKPTNSRWRRIWNTWLKQKKQENM